METPNASYWAPIVHTEPPYAMYPQTWRGNETPQNVGQLLLRADKHELRRWEMEDEEASSEAAAVETARRLVPDTTMTAEELRAQYSGSTAVNGVQASFDRQ